MSASCYLTGKNNIYGGGISEKQYLAKSWRLQEVLPDREALLGAVTRRDRCVGAAHDLKERSEGKSMEESVARIRKLSTSPMKGCYFILTVEREALEKLR